MAANLVQDLVVRSKSRRDDGRQTTPYQDMLPGDAAAANAALDKLEQRSDPDDGGVSEFPTLAVPSLDAKYFWAEFNEIEHTLQY